MEAKTFLHFFTLPYTIQNPFVKIPTRVFKMRRLITNSSAYTRVSASEGDEGKTRLSGGALQNTARSSSPLYPPEP